MLDLSDGLAIDARRLAAASAVALDLDAALTPAELDGGEDHSLLATVPPEIAGAGLGVGLPGGFRAIGVVRGPRADGHGLLVGGVPYVLRGGWDPYDGWDGGAG